MAYVPSVVAAAAATGQKTVLIEWEVEEWADSVRYLMDSRPVAELCFHKCLQALKQAY